MQLLLTYENDSLDGGIYYQFSFIPNYYGFSVAVMLLI